MRSIRPRALRPKQPWTFSRVAGVAFAIYTGIGVRYFFTSFQQPDGTMAKVSLGEAIVWPITAVRIVQNSKPIISHRNVRVYFEGLAKAFEKVDDPEEKLAKGSTQDGRIQTYLETAMDARYQLRKLNPPTEMRAWQAKFDALLLDRLAELRVFRERRIAGEDIKKVMEAFDANTEKMVGRAAELILEAAELELKILETIPEDIRPKPVMVDAVKALLAEEENPTRR